LPVFLEAHSRDFALNTVWTAIGAALDQLIVAEVGRGARGTGARVTSPCWGDIIGCAKADLSSSLGRTIVAAGCRMPRMEGRWESVRGILAKGYGVASGPSADYPYGALERQMPIFKARGLDLSALFPGTLNIDIRPFIFALFRPEFTFRAVRWTDLHPPEDFSFARCRIIFRQTAHDGWLYYPHPETKRRNFQNPSMLEIIAPLITQIAVGDQIEVWLDASRVSLERLAASD
jgi:hypothetical protein